MSYRASLTFLLAALALAFAAPAHAAWRQHTGPILRATQAWEGRTVQEPTVLRGAHGTYRMWYTGGFHGARMGYAESRDGLHWHKVRGPVLGGGAGGAVGQVAHTYIVRDGDLFLAFYAADPLQDGHETEDVAVSRDGQHWRRLGTALRPAAGELGFGNVYVWHDGRRWRMLVETLDADHIWRTRRAGSLSFPLHWRRQLSPLADLGMGGMYGGPSIERAAHGYRLLYHASPSGDLPTDIYQATSPDLNRWDVRRRPLVRREQPWEFDQVADPSRVGHLLYFSGMNNTAETGAIGVATNAPRRAVEAR